MSDQTSRFISSVDVLAPRAEIRFHNKSGLIEIKSKGQSRGQEDSLISCKTYKDIAQPAGAFVMYLTDRQRYDQVIKPMDLTTIKLSSHLPSNPKTNVRLRGAHRNTLDHATMIALVDSVRRKRLIDPNTGRPSVFCEIKGRDLGKLFIKHQIRYLPWLLGDEKFNEIAQPVLALFKFLLGGFKTGGPIDYLLANNIKNALTKAVNMEFNFNNKKINLRDMISVRFQNNLGVIPFNLPLMSQEGSLWQILMNYANPPWNEMWVDTVNAPNEVISDVSPFSSPLTPAEAQRDAVLRKTIIQKTTGAFEKDLSKSEADSFRQDAAGNVTEVNIATAFKFNTGQDSANAYSMLFCRRTPFDQRDWDRLRAVRNFEITNEDIQEQDIGISDNQVYNYFWVYPMLAVPEFVNIKGLGVRPMIFSKRRQFLEDIVGNSEEPTVLKPEDNLKKFLKDSEANAVEKFGFNPLELTTRIWRWAVEAKNSNATKVANHLMLAVANWHKHNSQLQEGSLTIKGAPDLHVGDMLTNIDENIEFYVEAVGHNYTQYRPLLTTAMVTRGQPAGGPLKNPDAFSWGNALSEASFLNPAQQETDSTRDKAAVGQ